MLKKYGTRSTGSAGAIGWAAGSAVVLDDFLRGKANDIASSLSFPLFLTSGIRTEPSQARGLRVKFDLGDNVHALYRQKDLINEVISAWNLSGGGDAGEAAILVVLYAQTARGRYLSAHMRGRCFDIRSKDKTAHEIEEIKAAIVASGGRYVIESKPPHIHVEYAA